MKNIIKGSLILLMTVLLGGCSKEYLNPVPKTSLGEAQAFDTKDRIVGQVNGMYARIKNGAFLGGRYYNYLDIRAENFLPKSTNLVTNYATWNHNVFSTTNEVQGLWDAVYSAVNGINIFIEGLNSNWASGKLTGIITQDEYNQYLSEALTLRAISYFSLLQLYAQPYNKNAGASLGLPLRLQAEKTGANNDLARSTVAETYTQILKDLNDAEPLAIPVYSSALLNTTRIHRNTIIAFKTRVYINMNNFAAVKTEAAKIVPAAAPFIAPTGHPFQLAATFAAIWNTPYTSAESIFSMPFTETNTAGTQNSKAHYNHPTSSESYYLNRTAQAFTSLVATDARRVLFQDGLVNGVTEYYVGKWRMFTPQTDYANVIRYAEVLLNYAEALVRDGNVVTQQAVNLLNAVRTRSYPAGAYVIGDFANAAAFQNAIMLERNIEFLGEGMRNMDLSRNMMTLPAKGSSPAVLPTDPGYVWPIPENEMIFNKAMIQN